MKPVPVLYGDGSQERRIIPAIARRLAPALELKSLQTGVATIGLDAVLDSLAEVASLKHAPVAKLIELVHRDRVDPAKTAIKSWLRGRRMKDRDLVERAPARKLREAFMPLAVALEKIREEDP